MGTSTALYRRHQILDGTAVGVVLSPVAEIHIAQDDASGKGSRRQQHENDQQPVHADSAHRSIRGATAVAPHLMASAPLPPGNMGCIKKIAAMAHLPVGYIHTLAMTMRTARYWDLLETVHKLFQCLISWHLQGLSENGPPCIRPHRSVPEHTVGHSVSLWCEPGGCQDWGGASDISWAP